MDGVVTMDSMRRHVVVWMLLVVILAACGKKQPDNMQEATWGQSAKNPPAENFQQSPPRYGASSQLGQPRGYRQFFVRIHNINYRGEVYVNGALVATARMGGDTGWKDVTPFLRPGVNELSFRVTSERDRYSYYFGIMEGERVTWQHACGLYGKVGCDNPNLGKGQSLVKKFTIEI